MAVIVRDSRTSVKLPEVSSRDGDDRVVGAGEQLVRERLRAAAFAVAFDDVAVPVAQLELEFGGFEGR